MELACVRIKLYSVSSSIQEKKLSEELRADISDAQHT